MERQYCGAQPHSKSPNHKRLFRAITNPPMTLKEPLYLNRPDEDYVRAFLASLPEKMTEEGFQSLVEQVVLNRLGVTSLPDWKVTGPRDRYQPRTAPGKAARIQGELERMLEEAKRKGQDVDSVHLRGEKLEQERNLQVRHIPPIAT